MARGRVISANKNLQFMNHVNFRFQALRSLFVSRRRFIEMPVIFALVKQKC
jgi:hypothetical protein